MQSGKQLLPSLFLAASLCIFMLPATADSGCGPLDGRGYSREYRVERIALHQKKLHDALGLDADQEVAWKKLTESEGRMIRHEQGKTDDWPKLSTPERSERIKEGMQAQQVRMTEHLSVLEAFYAQLTTAQKKIFDDFHNDNRRSTRGKPAPQPAPMAPRAAFGNP